MRAIAAYVRDVTQSSLRHPVAPRLLVPEGVDTT